MQLSRALTALCAATIVAVVACSDSGPLQPDASRTIGTSGKTDTSKSTPPTTNPTSPTKPDSGRTTPSNPGPTGPDTAGSVKPSTDPRSVSGVVFGMGPASDSANYQRVAGATVIWKGFDGKELARAVTAADGSYSLGSFKPASYMLSVTPPASGPFKGIEWAYIISEYSPAKIDLNVWLARK